MFCAGSFTSQVLQWTQFCALIWNLLVSPSAHHLIDQRRAIALRRLGIFRKIPVNRDATGR